MCGGSTQAQNNIEQQQQQQYGVLANNYAQEYGEDQSVLNGLTSALNPIIQAGPSQLGFSNNELNNLNASATENTGQSYAQEKQAVGENEAATGGTSFIPSGASTQVQGELAANSENQLDSEKSQIMQADYQQGNQNYDNAVQGELGVASALNPTAAGSVSVQGGAAAGTTANQIAQENNSVWGSVLGALGGVAGAAVGNPSGLMSMFGNSAGTNLANGENAIAQGNIAIQNMQPVYDDSGVPNL